MSREHLELGRWIGIVHRIGRDMPYWIMPIYGQPVSEATVQHVTRSNILDPDIAAQMKVFDHTLTECLDNVNFIIDEFYGFEVEDEGRDMPQWDTWDPLFGGDKTTPTEAEYNEMMKDSCLDVGDIGSFDNYIGVTVKLEDITKSAGSIATMKWHATNENGFSIVRAHNNSLLDTQ